VLSAVTKDGVKEGMLFTREFMNKTTSLGFDGFGENGEFHSVAEVWSVSRDEALGL
jgi:diphthamide synthase (EF-2-diphthine--ammonia ligase)